MFDNFKNYMLTHVALTEAEWTIMIGRLKYATFSKGALITKMGDVHERIYFVNNGLARACTFNEEGKDFTWSIYFNDTNAEVINLFITDYDSFITKRPSRLEIEALEACELVYLTYEDIAYLEQQAPQILHFSKKMADLAYSFLHHKVIDAQSKSAKERFLDFIQTTPHLLDKVPQYHIASYLGITPIHLSRLKKVYK